MNGLKKIVMVSLFGLVGASSCGPIYPVIGGEWIIEDDTDIVDTQNDFDYDKITFKVSWAQEADDELILSVRTPQGNDIYEGDASDGCYFTGTTYQSPNRLVSTVECPDSYHGEYSIRIDNPGYYDVNAKIEVIESYYNGRTIVDTSSIQNRNVQADDDIKVLYDF